MSLDQSQESGVACPRKRQAVTRGLIWTMGGEGRFTPAGLLLSARSPAWVSLPSALPLWNQPPLVVGQFEIRAIAPHGLYCAKGAALRSCGGLSVRRRRSMQKVNRRSAVALGLAAASAAMVKPA